MRAMWVVPRVVAGLFTLLVLATAPVVAQALPSLAIGEATGAPGSSVAVPIGFNTDGTVSVAQVDILFDPDLLSLTSVTAGGALTPNHSLDTALIAPGRQRVVITTVNAALLGSGTLVSLAYTIDAAAPAGSVPLTWDGVVLGDADGLAVAPTSLASGAVTVTGGGTPPPPPPAPEEPSGPDVEPQPIPTLPLLASLLLILLLVFTVRRRLPVASAAVVLCAGLLAYSGASQAQPLRGDANGDGVVNAADILVIVDQILGRGMAPGNADCNDDGVVNVLDTVCSAREIVPGSTPPQLIAPGDRTIPVDVTFAMNLFALDPDPGETLTFTLDSGPAGIQVDAQSGVLSWTPGPDNLGGNTLTVRVTDSTAQFDTASFTITVTEGPPLQPTNSPPQLMVPENQITRIGTPLALQASASDPDPGDSVTFSLVNAPAGMTIDPETGSLGWTPGAGQTGLADVVVRATDTRDAAAFGTFTVDAREINRAPVARDDVYIARKGETLLVDAAAGVLRNDSDPDNDSLNATLLSDPTKGTLESFAADGSFSYAVDAPTPITIGLVEKCSSAARVRGGAIAVGDVDQDGVVELVAIVQNGSPGSAVFIVDPTDCSSEVFDIPLSMGQAYHEAVPTLVNLDDDPELEIVTQYQRFNDSIVDGVAGADERLYAVKLDGTPLDAWVTTNGAFGLSAANSFDVAVNPNHVQAAPVAVDLNGDGVPALIMGLTNVNVNTTVGNTTRNAVVAYDGRTGAILWEFIGGITRPLNDRAAGPTIVDLDLDGDPEIIWSQHVLDHEGNLLFDLPVEQTIPGGGSDFLTVAIANFDNDAYPEIISFDASNITLYSHTGAIQWQRPYDAGAFQFPWSDITVAELDGDPFPEFVIVLPDENGVDLTLRAFDSDGQDLWSQADTGFVVKLLDESRNSSPIAIDLDGDGIDELIQLKSDTSTDNNAAGLYIIDGATGGIIAFQPGDSNLRSDQTLTVADVDGDGSAEIMTNMGSREGFNPIQIWDNLPGEPFADARPFRSGANGQPTWANVDGSLPTRIEPHWLQPGRNGWNRVPPDRDPYEPEQDSFTYRVSDGALDSNTATVNLEIRPAGNPPFFLSEPRAGTSRGVAYTYTPLVVDVDPGDVVSFELVAGPPGMTLDPETGRLDWNPEAIGEFPVSILASDTLGFSTAQIFRLRVGDPVLVPDVIGLTEAAAGDTLTSANLHLGERSLRSDPVVPSGEVLEQSPPAGALADFGSAVRVTVSSGAGAVDTDADGDGFTPNQGDCDDSDASMYPGAPEIDGDGIDQNCNGIDGNKTLVAIEVTPGSKRVLTNQPIPLTATGIFDDGTAQNLTAVASWTRGPTFFSGTAGNVSAEASFLGVTGSADFVVLDRVADEVAPVARIDSPEAGTVVTAPTDIVGMVTDSNLLRWELAYRQDGQGDFVRFAEGSNFIGTSRAIATFDPTVLLNGLYTIRLQVFDRGGNVSEDTTTVQVQGQLKVGKFTLSYVDLELPLNGIPITLTRNYDSRDKRMGDFGVGWRLGVNSIEIRTNRELGTGWQVFRQGLTYGLVETDVHLAAVRLPGGRIEAFEMVVDPNVSPIVPFPPFSQSVRFEPLPGTLGTLQSLEENNVSILDAQPGPVSLRLDSNGDIYNPTLFRYTSPDGMKLDIDTIAGMRRAETPGGQVLTFTPTNIRHSNGTVVNIERDGLGRITRVTDPGGFSQTYRYDANGDLRAHSDQEDYVTRFDYDADHNVINITDPLGRLQARNEYDDNGRLISMANGSGGVVRYAHDIAGRQEVRTDPDGFVTVYDYDEAGNIVRVTDALGGVTTNTFDAAGNRISSTNAAGETTTWTYDVSGNMLSVTSPAGGVTRYSYDSAGNVLERTDPLGRQTFSTYDTGGYLVSHTNPAGNSETRLRGADGNVVAVTDFAGRTTRFEYNARGYQTARVDARGNRTESNFNANGVVTGQADARGGLSTISADGRGLPAEVVTPENRVMTFAFNGMAELTGVGDGSTVITSRTVDARGRVTRFDGGDGNAREMFFDARGNRIRVEDGSGRSTSYSYDELGRQVAVTLPGGGVQRTHYDAVGRVTSKTDPEGNVTSYEYDAAGRNTAVVDALGNRSEYSYDLVGNLIARLDARGNITAYTYDALDRLIQTEYPDGSITSIAYDAVGNVVAETDRLGRIKSYAYDPNDNLISVTDIGGSVTTYAYDENNNRISQTDANGNTTRMVYDANDRLIEKQYPDGSTERLEYNAASQIARTILPDGKYIDATYDGFGRPTGHDLNGEETESFTYDGAGRLTQAINLWGTVEYDYNADGRVTEIRSEGGHSVSYSYDDFGNRTSIATQIAGRPARTTTYTYDALNRLATIVEPDGDTTTYGYDPVGNVASITYPNDVVSSFTYDNLNQVIRIEHSKGAAALAAYDYSLDAGGRRTRVDLVNGDSVSYSYDSADRLLRETHRNVSNVVIFEQSFSYDNVGNRLTQQISGQAQTLLAYDSADKLLGMGSTSYAYDANGRLISRTAPQGMISYTYDVEGQLLRVTTSTGTVTFGRDASGKRRLRTVNGSEQNFLLDEASLTGYDQVLVAFDQNDDQLVEYHWGDRLISANDGVNDRFYHSDASRNTRLLTDEAGSISDTWNYDAFGNIRNRTGVASSPYGFAGEWHEESADLVFLRARFYDPSTGRFVSRDPFVGDPYDPVSLHRYLYANANPIMNTDPTGQFTLAETVVISGLIAFDAALIVSYFNGETLEQALPKAVIAGIFGAAGGLLGRGAGAVVEFGVSRFGSVIASEVARKWYFAAAQAIAQGFVSAVVGVGQLAATIGDQYNGSLGRAEFTKLFFITFVAELVTNGYWQPVITREVDVVETAVLVRPVRNAEGAAAQGLLGARVRGGAAGTELFGAWTRSTGGVGVIEFLETYAKQNRGASADAASSILKAVNVMSEEAVGVITRDLVRVKAFPTTDAATTFVESMKQVGGALFDKI